MSDLIKLPAEFKAEWLKRLRPGEVEQGQGKLRRLDNAEGKRVQCCLGVACDVKGVEWTREKEDNYYYPGKQRDANYPREESLPEGVDKVFTQNMQKEKDIIVSVRSFLASHNDGQMFEKWTFDQIADWIEANL